MKVEELMVGDWVYRNGKDEPMKVLTIGEHGCCLGFTDGYCGEAEDLIEPIPLTKEILEKNGFEVFNGGYYIIKVLEDDEVPTLYVWNGYDSIWVVDYCSMNKYTYIKDCKYVHEFQHELKSCGIEKEIVL